MADSLRALLAPHLDSEKKTGTSSPAAASKYLTRLTTLSLDSLQTSEVQSLAQSSHSVTLSLQALANRSNKAIITSADSLRTLHTSLPAIARDSTQLRDAVPKLDEEAVHFSTTYSKSGQNAILDRRKKAMLLSRNVDRLSDILELPALLSTAISSSSITGSTTSGANYSSALDLFAHIRRLQILYPSSAIVKSVLAESEEAMKEMTSNLIASLRPQQIRLAAAIRTIGWLRRVAPDLAQQRPTTTTATQDEESFGALFLVCRLANLLSMLEALAPLRELADQESERRQQATEPIEITKQDKPALSRRRSDAYLSGQQSERYLKRYIEIFREQSFSTISMYKNIFPSDTRPDIKKPSSSSGLFPLPPALQTFPLHLVDLLSETLRTYMPNVMDESARESLLTQALFAGGSLGREGADFGLMISTLSQDSDDEDDERALPEYQKAMKAHREQSSRLQALASHGLG